MKKFILGLAMISMSTNIFANGQLTFVNKSNHAANVRITAMPSSWVAACLPGHQSKSHVNRATGISRSIESKRSLSIPVFARVRLHDGRLFNCKYRVSIQRSNRATVRNIRSGRTLVIREKNGQLYFANSRVGQVVNRRS